MDPPFTEQMPLDYNTVYFFMQEAQRDAGFWKTQFDSLNHRYSELHQALIGTPASSHSFRPQSRPDTWRDYDRERERDRRDRERREWERRDRERRDRDREYERGRTRERDERDYERAKSRQRSPSSLPGNRHRSVSRAPKNRSRSKSPVEKGKKKRAKHIKKAKSDIVVDSQIYENMMPTQTTEEDDDDEKVGNEE